MFKIGEFSRIAYLSVHQLRHYDEIGLFKPIHIDAETGYRYYSVEQLPRLNRIVALKNLGLTLDQIRGLLEGNIDACDLRGMLMLRKAQVEQIITTETMRLQEIETRLKQIEHEGEPSEYSVVIKSIPEQGYCSTGRVTAPDSELVKMSREIYALVCESQNRKPAYGISVIHEASTDEGWHNVEVGYPIEADTFKEVRLFNGVTARSYVLPAVDVMATVVYSGSRMDIHRAYASMFQWMEANHYNFKPDFAVREVYLQATLTDAEPDNIVEIQIPITQVS